MVSGSWQKCTLLSSCTILLSLYHFDLAQGLNFEVDSHFCSGEIFSVQELEILCPDNSGCGLGREVQMNGNLVAHFGLPTTLDMYAKAYIPGLISAPIFDSMIYPCDYVVRTTTDDDAIYDACPDPGSYNFTASSTIPEDGNTLWWSTGQPIYVSLTLSFYNVTSITTTCTMTLQPITNNNEASTNKGNGNNNNNNNNRFIPFSSSKYTTYGAIVASVLFLIAFVIGYVRKLRDIVSCRKHIDINADEYQSRFYLHRQEQLERQQSYLEMIEDPRDTNVRMV